MNTNNLPIQTVEGGVKISVRVQPKAKRTGITGLHDNRIKVSVIEPPEKGKANHAVRKLIAKTLNVAASQVELLNGATNRDKDLLVTGVSDTDAREKFLS